MGTRVPVRTLLDTEFTIRTVQEDGWAGIKNGELLRRASEHFEVFVTADRNLPRQQNIPRSNIGVVVIAAIDTRLPHLRGLLPQIRNAIANVAPGSVVTVTTF